jgi:hypothetical protein
MRTTIVGLGACLALTVLTQAPVWTAGQTTPWGHPDIQGVWTSEPELGVPFERSAEFGEREELTDEEFAERVSGAEAQLERDRADFDLETADISRAGAVGSPTSPPPHWLERGTPSRRTSMVIAPANGRLPERVARSDGRGGRGGGQSGGRGGAGRGVSTNADAQRSFESWLDMGLYDRCITRGMPGAIFPAIYNANTRIVQGPDSVAITYEMIHETRVIPLVARAPLPEDHDQFAGDGRGHWEGDTLVVESGNYPDGSTFRGASPTARLVERFTRVDDETLRYEVTVIDPEIWTAPWTAALNMKTQPGGMFEYACHEGNRAMRNMLSGARAADAGTE